MAEVLEKLNAASSASLPPRRTPPHPVFWVIAAALSALAINVWVRPSGAPLSAAAFAQMPTGGGARGVFAFSGQMTKNSFGVYIVDVDTMTMWAYEYQAAKACLRLAAARTWRYDRYLENHNICDLPPDAVEQMVDEQRKYRLGGAEKVSPSDDSIGPK